MKSALFTALVALLCLAHVVIASRRSYENYGLFSVSVSSDEFYHQLLEKFDIWGKSKGSVKALDVFAEISSFESFMAESSESYFLISSNIQHLLDAESQRLKSTSASSNSNDWFLEYHDYNATKSWYQGLAQQYPTLATFIPSVGATWENREIFAFRITTNPDLNRPKFWMQCNIHAREWITSATCQYAVNHILENAASDPAIASLLSQLEFVIIPIVNPDGYAFTWSNDRLWRKNRRDNGNSYGVDLNRNYDAQWGGTGSSGTPSSDTYRGPSANSEPEVKALTSYFLSQTNMVGALDVHSYSQLILRPYTHTNAACPDEALLSQLSDEVVSIIREVHDKRFTPGPWYSALYASSGVSQDYYYARGAFALTFELRPTTAVPGFVLPPEEIVPSGEEITPAILHFAEFALANNKRR